MTSRLGIRAGGAVRSPMSAWHDAHANLASATWRRCENITCSGSLVTGFQKRTPLVWSCSQAAGATEAGAVA
ncbi:MAG: hypothetical protein NUW22_06195 [Acidobacteria bacterium]|nr:hypothetical protein [Acidobacteriota bacterium]